jgi:lysophospholipase L1-like esterase
MMHRRRQMLLALPALVLAGAAACRSSAIGDASAETKALTYVAIGASDSVGVGAGSPDQESWPADLQRRLPSGSQLVNLGISGSLLQQALEQQLPVALDSAPDLVTAWMAVNDYAAKVPLDQYAADLDALLSALRARTSAVILVGNVPDLSALPSAGRFDLRDVGRWNAAIEEAVRRNDARLVDLRATWNEVSEHPEYISSDGFHPSTTGYRRLADIFYAAAADALHLPA